MSTYLDISQISIDFPTKTGPFRALEKVDLKIARGEFISLIGHSGCGKSTVLNIVAGLYQATEGAVVLESKEVNQPGPDRAVVFQNHSLFPWLTVYQNVELAVKQVFKGRKSKAEIRHWVEYNLGLVQMSHASHKLPGEISGGMKQRVGIARALAMEPKVLLMDPAATVGEILSIDLPRPRERLALADNVDYNHYRAAVLTFLHQKQAKSDHKTSTKKPHELRLADTNKPAEVAFKKATGA